ncbi:tRNA pseudouridine(13) synthase TruD [Candidatus Woesearchaeota archaeon]|nr:tRNA pseudouridine(13) synthase TruD [Candidatus Woesearchaeota archaeon]
MYVLKQLPEDFIVREISNIQCKDNDKYIYFQLKKREMNTLDAVKLLARVFNVSEKNIGFAGSKDKNAITTQVCSIQGISKEQLLGSQLKYIGIELLGYGDQPISLGDLEGNYFEIIIRNLGQEKMKEVKAIINYFDEQRFSKNNVKIGKHIVKKEFKEAVKLIDEDICTIHLQERANDYIGALKKLPLRLLRLYINAYQSYIWNKTVAEFLGKEGKKMSYSLGELVFVDKSERFLEMEIPIIGFLELEDYNNDIVKGIISRIMQQEGIEYGDFVIKQIPQLSLEGGLRSIAVEVKNLVIGTGEDDELNIRKRKVRISFSLGKGSYATMVIKTIFL